MTTEQYLAIFTDGDNGFDQAMTAAAREWMGGAIERQGKRSVNRLSKDLGIHRNRLTRLLKLLGLYDLAANRRPQRSEKTT